MKDYKKLVNIAGKITVDIKGGMALDIQDDKLTDMARVKYKLKDMLKDVYLNKK